MKETNREVNLERKRMPKEGMKELVKERTKSKCGRDR
jgi:hypothetical protein